MASVEREREKARGREGKGRKQKKERKGVSIKAQFGNKFLTEEDNSSTVIEAHSLPAPDSTDSAHCTGLLINLICIYRYYKPHIQLDSTEVLFSINAFPKLA